MDENPYRAPQEVRMHANGKRRMPLWFAVRASAIRGLALALNAVGIIATVWFGFAASQADTSPREQTLAVVVAGVVLGILSLNLWLLRGRDQTRPWLRVAISVVGNAVFIALFAQSWLFVFRRYGSMVPPFECVGSIAIGTVSILAVVVGLRTAQFPDGAGFESSRG
jgi:hypothetical protein